MNRAQRRQLSRQQQQALEAESRMLKAGRSPRENRRLDMIDAAMSNVQKNGITVDTLKQNYDLGYRDGVNDSADMIARAAYSASMLALRKHFHFGKKRMLRFLTEMDALITTCIDRQDMIDEACRQTGLAFRADDPFERFREL